MINSCVGVYFLRNTVLLRFMAVHAARYWVVVKVKYFQIAVGIISRAERVFLYFCITSVFFCVFVSSVFWMVLSWGAGLARKNAGQLGWCVRLFVNKYRGCMMYKKERAENLKNNIKYLIRSRGETQLSLCSASGLTRTTIYNILEGKVVNVQQSTIRKISDFFGVSYKEIESVDFEEREIIESSISFQGNMNPAAVPIVKESQLVQSMNKRIGELSTMYPLTYYFGAACNLIGVLLENEISGANESGDLLIVKKGLSNSGGEVLVYDKITKKLFIVNGAPVESDAFCVVGEILEERF